MTNIVKIDELGRILLSKEIRRKLDIEPQDEVLIKLVQELIVVTKVDNQCIFCESEKDIYIVKGKYVCIHCVKELGFN